MDGVGALWGASLCKRIKRKQRGGNGWLRAWTKRGAGTVRRVRIQILSGKMLPLSVGIYSRQTGVWRVGTKENSSVNIRRSGFRNITMASSHCSWIALFLLSVMTSDTGVFGRAVDPQGFLSQSPEIANESYRPTLRTDALRHGVTEAHRERCAELAAPWMENTQAPQDNSNLLHLRVRPFSPGVSRGLVFPGKSLFSFVRQVYHCCQDGLNCRSVKGIQGRLRGGKTKYIQLKHIILQSWNALFALR